MAEKNKNKRRISLDTKKLDTVQNITAGRTYGVDQSFFNDIEEDRKRIKDAIKNVNERHNEIAGNGYIEFFTSMIFEEDKKNKKGPVVPSIESQQSFNNLLNSTNSVSLSAMFENEKERITLYDEYESVMNFIPQVYQAIDAIADAIISPDDYSKDILSVYYDGKENPDSKEYKRVIKNIRTLEDKYHFEDKLKKIIFKSLYLGDSFVLVSSLKKEFNKILTESSDTFLNESVTLSESNFNISEEELNVFKELFLEEDETEKEKSNKKLTPKEEKSLQIKKTNENKKIKKDILDMFNNNVEFSNNSSSLFEKEMSLAKEFKATPIQSDYESIINKKIKEVKKDDSNSSLLLTNVDEKEVKRSYSAMNKNTFIDGKDKKFKDIDITGSYIKVLEPERIVKLRMGTTCFGYFYIETELPNRMNHSAFSMGNRLTDFKLKNPVDITTSNVEEELNNPKIKLITDIFGRALASKVNKKFIEDNREFKTIIYELLKQEYITKKRVRIVYLGPDEVFHFRPEEAEDGYGVSKLEKVLFTCKIYIATLVTNLMMKLSRSADHRAFYVETGLSKDIEGTVQSFMRDIKSKEVRLNDLQTIDTIFRSIGQLNVS